MTQLEGICQNLQLIHNIVFCWQASTVMLQPILTFRVHICWQHRTRWGLYGRKLKPSICYVCIVAPEVSIQRHPDGSMDL